MAEKMNIAKSSKMIFQNITFFMRPCKERQDLRPIIEKEGGKITSKATTDCYKLAEKGSLVSRDGYISSDFVEDCVSQGKLLDSNKYKVKPGTVSRPDSDRSLNEGTSDDSFEHACTIIKTSAKDWKGRSKYTKEEDIAIITYLIEERKYHEASGMKVWKEMELLKVTNHTADSMSTHYRKYILLNLDKYKYDIEKSWMSKLTGYVPREKEPEFSFDALFPKPKKRPLEMVSNSSKDKKDSGVKKILNSLNPSVLLVDKQKKSSEEKVGKDGSIAEKNAEKKKSDDSKDNKSSEKTLDSITVSQKKINENNTQSKNNTADKSDISLNGLGEGRISSKSGHYQEEFESFITHVGLARKQKRVDDENFDKSYTSKKRLRQHVSPIKCSSQGFDLSSHNKPAVLAEKNSNRSAVDVVTVESSGDIETNAEDEITVISSPDSVDSMLARYLDDCHKMRNESQTNTSNKEKHKNKENTIDKNEIQTIDKNVDAKNGSGKNNKNEDLVSKVDSPIANRTRHSIVNENETNCRKDKTVETDTDTSKTDNPVAKRTRHSLVNDKETVNEKSGSKTNSENNRKDGGKDRKNADRGKHDVNILSQEGEKNKGMQKRLTRSTAKPTHGNVHINLDTSDDDETGSEKSDGDDSPRNEQKQTEDIDNSSKESRVQEVVSICKAIAEDYDVSAGYVKELLYGFSGDVNKAVYWLKFGPDFADHGPWTDSDDERLLSEDLHYLQCKYGEASLAARQLFLDIV